ncbi:hypothetical protein GCM10022223_39980 [Kineosporia mesophila]|uniref:Uncharacterized protein n=1 Tax=Kineosporia mesophila TaxID=566012 RepID=A0ABP6ZX25_9ACTN
MSLHRVEDSAASAKPGIPGRGCTQACVLEARCGTTVPRPPNPGGRPPSGQKTAGYTRPGIQPDRPRPAVCPDIFAGRSHSVHGSPLKRAVIPGKRPDNGFL